MGVGAATSQIRTVQVNMRGAVKTNLEGHDAHPSQNRGRVGQPEKIQASNVEPYVKNPTR